MLSANETAGAAVPGEPQLCVVVGAGPAGLGTAAMLRERGIDPLLIDRAPEVAASWRARYDGFCLNTSSWFSFLPGRRFPREAGRWPSRDALVAYYDSYAKRHALRFRGEIEVERIDRADGGWTLRTSGGPIETRYVVVATGNTSAKSTRADRCCGHGRCGRAAGVSAGARTATALERERSRERRDGTRLH